MLRIGFLILIVLFSSSKIPEHTGKIYILFSNVVLNEPLNADIYSAYSTITIENAEINGEILSLSSKVYVQDSNEPTIRPLIPAFSLFLRDKATLSKSPYLVYDDSIPLIVFQFAFILLQLFLFYIFISIKKSFFEQSALAVQHEIKYVFTGGITAYFIFVCVALAFFLSIIAIPISVLFILLCCMFVVVGQAPFSIAIGNVISKKIFSQFRLHTIYSDLLLGMLLIFLVKTIPFVNLFAYFIVLPIFCLGTLTTAWVNGSIRKVFYPSNYTQNEIEKVFHKSKIRDMIMERK